MAGEYSRELSERVFAGQNKDCSTRVQDGRIAQFWLSADAHLCGWDAKAVAATRGKKESDE